MASFMGFALGTSTFALTAGLGAAALTAGVAFSIALESGLGAGLAFAVTATLAAGLVGVTFFDAAAFTGALGATVDEAAFTFLAGSAFFTGAPFFAVTVLFADLAAGFAAAGFAAVFGADFAVVLAAGLETGFAAGFTAGFLLATLAFSFFFVAIAKRFDINIQSANVIGNYFKYQFFLMYNFSKILR
ncbi:MAG: hypothetical protein KA340_00340 [Saprospiraceae bacterium]|nr:hypothetical protein [Saprospiraceae bacterium]